MNQRSAPPALRLLYFWIGILATLAYRAIIVVDRFSGPGVKIAWYVGTVGFVIYFAHRYAVSERRARLIRRQRLDEKVAAAGGFTDEDRAALQYILGTLETTKEKWNYVVIFASSGLALAIGLLLDLQG